MRSVDDFLPSGVRTTSDGFAIDPIQTSTGVQLEDVCEACTCFSGPVPALDVGPLDWGLPAPGGLSSAHLSGGDATLMLHNGAGFDLLRRPDGVFGSLVVELVDTRTDDVVDSVRVVRSFPPGTEVLLIGASRDAVDDLVRGLSLSSGATFGLTEVSSESRKLEQFLKVLKEKDTHDQADQETVLKGMQTIQALTAAATDTGNTCDSLADSAGFEKLAAKTAQRTVNEKGKWIYLFDNEAEHSQNLTSQLENFGYYVHSCASSSELVERVQQQRPAIILADIELADEGLNRIQARQDNNIPLIFLTNRIEFDARLQAVRAGGGAFFAKPVAIEALVDSIDDLLNEGDQEPPRVLVVDDVSEQAELNALVLRQAGMSVTVETDPMQVYQTIDEFQPELILMDMHMPECNGTELAAVIRQRPEYVGVPITFLSSETDRDLQLNALRRGGDEFLNKSITPWELAESVAIRVERYRVLRSFMTRDSLTGLLNHSNLIENLDHEVSRTIRYGGCLSFAMLDIDHFKSVNDRYGHGAGDRVIKNLSRLLQQRLRKTDIIARYGGEEFAVIMPETPLPAAIKVMDEVRNNFSQITHHAGDEEFQVTLSCGVASAPPISDETALRETADQLLYRAKHGGRNQTIGAA